MSKTEEKKSKQANEAPRRSVFMFLPEELFLETDPNKPHYDERVNLPVDEWLVEDIRLEGVLEPIGVLSGSDSNTVIFGRQRVKATAEANKRNAKEGTPLIRIPAQMIRATERGAFGKMLSENIQRTDYTPVQLANLVAQYEQTYGATDEEIMAKFRLKPGTLKALRALITTSASVQKAVETGKIGLTSAVELAKLETKEAQNTALAELVESGAKISTKAVKEAAKKSPGKKKRKKRKDAGPSKDELIAFAKAVLGFEEDIEHADEELPENRVEMEGFALGVLYALGAIKFSFDELNDLAEKYGTAVKREDSDEEESDDES